MLRMAEMVFMCGWVLRGGYSQEGGGRVLIALHVDLVVRCLLSSVSCDL